MSPTIGRPFARVLAYSIGFGILGLATMLGTRRPRNDRVWALDHSRAPRILVSDSIVHIDGVRRFRYRTATDYDAAWSNRSYDLRRLQSVWFVLTPLSARWRGPAHGFVSFGFDDSTYVAISVEARRELGEEYGVGAGLLRSFELIYVIGDELDLIGRRALLEDFDVYLYPIAAPRAKIQRLFLAMVARAEALRRQPEFYNTVTNSCVSNLVAHVNQITPGKIPYGLKLVFPGYADLVARQLGLLDSTLPMDAARRRYRVNDLVRRHAGDPLFSLGIRSRPDAIGAPAVPAAGGPAR